MREIVKQSKFLIYFAENHAAILLINRTITAKMLALPDATFMLRSEMDESIKPLIIVFSISGKTTYFESKIISS